MSNRTFTLLMRAFEIPDGAIVTKRTGEKEYMLKRDIKIYGEAEGECREVTVKEGFVFLIPKGGGNINAVSEGTKLLRHGVDEYQMINLVDSMEDK